MVYVIAAELGVPEQMALAPGTLPKAASVVGKECDSDRCLSGFVTRPARVVLLKGRLMTIRVA